MRALTRAQIAAMRKRELRQAQVARRAGRTQRASAAAALVALALCAVWLLATPRAAGQPETERAQIQRGSLLYQIHCLQCHGEMANGRGPMAKELRILPANLRTIAARNGGSFPRDTVYESIDGTRFVRGHGEQQMPVWGMTFLQRDTDTNQAADVEARIEALIAFLRSIQE